MQSSGIVPLLLSFSHFITDRQCVFIGGGERNFCYNWSTSNPWFIPDLTIYIESDILDGSLTIHSIKTIYK